MWSSTQRFPWKFILSPEGMLFQTSFRRRAASPSWRQLSIFADRLFRTMQCHFGQQYAIQRPFLHRSLFSNTSLSNSSEVIVDGEGNDAPEQAVTTASRRRRPLRISSVPSRNIGEQRLYSSPGLEERYDRTWTSNVKKFRAFVEQNFQRTTGQAPRRIQPSDYPEDSSLRNWLCRVRTDYHKKLRGQPNRLTEKRLQQLRELGFQFIETEHRTSWDTMFRQLCTYLKKHNGRYPHEADRATLTGEDLKLYIWCNRQRVLYKVFMNKQYKKTYMNEKRIKALNSINFVWSVLDSQWDEKYEELKLFRKEHGTALVPARYISNYSLSRWVETQRRQYTLRQKNKPSNLTDERIQLLNELDFVWDPLEVRWMENYRDLVAYQRLNGENTLPTHSSDPSLRRWLLKQRKQYNKWINGEPSKMTARRKELLDEVGMVWTAT